MITHSVNLAPITWQDYEKGTREANRTGFGNGLILGMFLGGVLGIIVYSIIV